MHMIDLKKIRITVYIICPNLGVREAIEDVELVRRLQPEDRLRVQGGADRRLGGGEDSAAGSLCQERVQRGFEGHHWGRVPDEDARHRQQDGQGSDLGHCWPREVSRHGLIDYMWLGFYFLFFFIGNCLRNKL